MMRLISGQPGNGKTLRALADMLAEYERNKSANALPSTDKKWEPLRAFYSNIKGVAFDWHEPMPEHRDWRQLPDGSYIVYDEAHSDGKTEGLEHYGLLFPSTGRPGESDDPRIRAMSTHRHSGKDLIFITQWPSKVHHNVRALLGSHTHMNRALGMQRAGVLTWSRVQVDPYDETQRDKAEEEIWAYPKDLYDKYQSATLHTASHKFKVPRKAWGALATLVMIPLVVWGLWLFVFKPDPVEQKPPQGQASAAPAAGAAPRGEPLSVDEWQRREQPRIADRPRSAPLFDGREAVSQPRLFCVSSKAGRDGDGKRAAGGCTCLTEQGTAYREITTEQCRIVAREGEPYNPFLAPPESRSEDRWGDRSVVAVASDSAGVASVSPAGSGKFGKATGYGGMGVGASPR